MVNTDSIGLERSHQIGVPRALCDIDKRVRRSELISHTLYVELIAVTCVEVVGYECVNSLIAPNQPPSAYRLW